MKKTKIIRLGKTKNGRVCGFNAAGQQFFGNDALVLTVGCWVTYDVQTITKARKDPAQPFSEENSVDVPAYQVNAVKAVFANVSEMAKGLSADLEGDMHINAYVKSLDASIAAQYEGAFTAAVA